MECKPAEVKELKGLATASLELVQRSRLDKKGNQGGKTLSRGLSRGGGGNPSFPSPSAGDLRELPRVPLRGEGSCGGGGAHCSILAWRIPWMEEPGRLQSMGSSIPVSGRYPGEENGNPLQYSCLGRSLASYNPWSHKELDVTEHTRIGEGCA